MHSVYDFDRTAGAFAKEFRSFLSDEQPVIFTISPQMKIIHTSPQFSTFYYIPQSFMKEPVQKMNTHAHSNVFCSLFSQISDCMKDRRILHQDTTLFGEIPVRIRTMPLYSPLNSLEGVMVEIINISEELSMKEQLERQRQRIAVSLEHSRMSIWEADFIKNTLHADSNFPSVFGIPAAHYSPMMPLPSPEQILRRCDRAHRGEMAAHIQRIINSSDEVIPQFDFQMRHLSKGSSIWIRNGGTVISRKEDGSPTRIIGYSIDITKDKAHETERLQKSSFLEISGELMHTGYAVVYPDSIIPLCSDELYRIFGFEPNEISPSFRLIESMVHPDHRSLFRQTVTAAEDLPRKDSMELSIIRRSGEQRMLSIIFHREYDPDGRRRYTLCIVQDITESRHSEATLSLYRKQMAETLAFTGTGFWSYQADTQRYTFSSTAKGLFFGDEDFPDEDLVSEVLQGFVHPEDRPLWKEDAELTVTDPEVSYSHSYRVCHRDRSVHRIRVNCNPLQGRQLISGFWGLIQQD